MNRLIRCVISFVLPIFCLLMSVSNADFSSTPLQITSQSWEVVNNSLATPLIGITSTNEEFYNACVSFAKYPDNSTYQSAFYSLVNSLDANGYGIIFGYQPKAVNSKGVNVFVFDKSTSIGFCAAYDLNDSNKACDILFTDCTEGYIFNGKVYSVSGIFDSYYLCSMGFESEDNSNIYSDNPYVYCSKDIKELYQSGGICWDGESYYYKAESDETDTPSLPSNSEIASAVQAFYNTIYNQPNIAFDDFIVLYDVSTGLYSYIGHTRGNAIGQVIVEPNGYYNGYKFDVQWWQFFLDEQNDSWEWQNITKYNNYYLYTSQGDIDTLEFVGQDKIDNLFSAGPWATSNTIIVYSTNDYPVKYITFSDESPDPVVEEGTIKGDQYTYDENLDITDNQYNPLDNFVTIDPTITIIGNVDFDEINKVFEENKNILIIENANWLFSANNQLFNYFSGFILFLIVLIIISRLLGG